MKQFFYSVIFFLPFCIWAQTDSLVDKQEVLDPLVFVVGDDIPASVTQLKVQADSVLFMDRDLGQDLPILLKNTPSLIATSDAGAGVGYTSMRIRGSDQTRINVTLNGIPINDSESQNVFWVNMPNLSSTLGSITIQKGIGTSTNGASSFGASVNMNTHQSSTKRFLRGEFSLGSFNTQKYGFQTATGNLGKKDQWQYEGGLSFIKSDGYIDRATSDLSSYNASIRYTTPSQHQFWLMAFGGNERTYQAWYGVDKTTLENDRTANFAGANYDEEGNIEGYYEDQVDDYQQNHFQLHYKGHINQIKISSALHYTYGTGFFEEFENTVNLEDYKLNAGTEDLVRRQWLKNHFFGMTFNLNTYLDKGLTAYAGGSVNRYLGDHFGRVIWVNNQPDFSESEYYFNDAIKDEVNTFIKLKKDFSKSWSAIVDLQFRNIWYQTDVPNSGINNALEPIKELDESFHFLSPKFQLNTSSDHFQYNFLYGFTQKEPNRSDFMDNVQLPKAEKLHDFELGVQTKSSAFDSFAASLNLFYMYYLDQLVLTGEVDDVGAFIRSNVGESYRMGIELQLDKQFNKYFSVFGNATLSKNQNINWKETINDALIDFGNTQTAFSPEFIGNVGFTITPIKGAKLQWISKFVSQQYMSNANYEESVLDGYSFSDIIVSYEWNWIKKSTISFNLMINNVFDALYENNGYYFNYYDGNANDPRGLNHNPFYYPQAGRNFWAGITIQL